MDKEAGRKMKHFLNEYQMVGGRNSFTDLPDPGKYHYPAITMPREQFVKFRNDFRLLLDFAGLMCCKPVEELCPLDLIAPFLKMAIALEEEED